MRPDLIAQLGLRVGGSVFIGQARFEIRGVISAEPGRRAGAFSLGPRVVVDRADLASTGLIGFGSRVSYQRLLQLPEAQLEPIVKRLRARLSNSFASVRSYHDTEARVRAQIEGAQHFLGLVGYVILVLGGIGVWSVTRVFLQQKRTSIAALKCLGASSGRILAVYVLQALVLGLAGSALGLLHRRPRPAGRALGRHRRARRHPPGPDPAGGLPRRRARHPGVDRQRAGAAGRHPPRQAAVAAARRD